MHITEYTTNGSFIVCVITNNYNSNLKTQIILAIRGLIVLKTESYWFIFSILTLQKIIGFFIISHFLQHIFIKKRIRYPIFF